MAEEADLKSVQCGFESHHPHFRKGNIMPEKRIRPKVFNSRKTDIKDKKLSTCSECRRGIFEGQETEWTGKGLIHTECSNDENKDAA